ncbi:MAG: hypothetical protein ACK53L_33060 [Pirellulaceae bacterium]
MRGATKDFIGLAGSREWGTPGGNTWQTTDGKISWRGVLAAMQRDRSCRVRILASGMRFVGPLAMPVLRDVDG